MYTRSCDCQKFYALSWAVIFKMSTRQLKHSSNYWCVVPGCNSDRRKKDRLQKYPWMENVTFLPFPTAKKNKNLRSKWLDMIRRPLGYEPLPHHRVCSRHFRPDSNVPELFPWNDYGQFTPKRGTTSIVKRETSNTDTCMNTETVSCESGPIICDLHVNTLNDPGTNQAINKDSFPVIVNDGTRDRFIPVVKEVDVATSTYIIPELENTECLVNQQDHNYSRASCTGSTSIDSTCDVGVQTELTLQDINTILLENDSLNKKMNNKDKLFKEIFIEKVTKNDDSVRKFTGLPNLEIFNKIKGIAVTFDPKMKYWTGNDSKEDKEYQNQGRKPGPSRKLSRSDEFILTLVRLRLALPVFVMSQLFGVSCSRVSSIYTTWMFFLYYLFKDCIAWPSRQRIKKFMPKSFQKSYPRTVAIIDCTEIFIQRPKNPTVNARTYSSYKSHNTFKFLVSITPTGAFNFISNIWGGNSSDRYITEHSGFLDKVSPGDEIMADRGFTIRDLLTERRAYLTIPPFTRKCNWGKGKYLSANDIKKTRKIANLRIHVERAIQRLKSFKLLSHTIPWNMKSLVQPMATVAAFFCNLHKPLVKS